MTTSDEVPRSHCNRCSHETKHTLLHEEKNTTEHFVENHGEIYWITTFRLLKCNGCDDVSLSKTVWFSEADDFDETFYPPRVSRPKPIWSKRLPTEYRGLLDEIYSALHSDNRRLAMMGARTAIDLFILRKVGDVGGFKAGLDALEKQGFISTKNRLVIESAIDAGHAAAHRAHLPSSDDVKAVMDIVENVIQHDVLHESAANLRQSTPQR